MRAKAAVRLNLPSQKHTEIALTALKPEVKKQIGTRSRVNLRSEGNCLILNVEAKDTTALRVAINVYLRWINSVLDVIEGLSATEPVIR